MTDFPAPTEIISGWIRQRAEAGVVLAQAVTDVTVDGDQMTIHIDQFNFPRAREWPVATSIYPEGIVEFYAVEFSWTNDQAKYLRSHIRTVQVMDADGNRVGPILNTSEYQQRKNPEFL